MDMLIFLARELSRLTNKEFLACKGLIRLAIKDHYGDFGRSNLPIPQMIEILLDNLRERLNKVNVIDADSISSNLVDYLLNNQSLFSFAF